MPSISHVFDPSSSSLTMSAGCTSPSETAEGAGAPVFETRSSGCAVIASISVAPSGTAEGVGATSVPPPTAIAVSSKQDWPNCCKRRAPKPPRATVRRFLPRNLSSPPWVIFFLFALHRRCWALLDRGLVPRYALHLTSRCRGWSPGECRAAPPSSPLARRHAGGSVLVAAAPLPRCTAV